MKFHQYGSAPGPGLFFKIMRYTVVTIVVLLTCSQLLLALDGKGQPIKDVYITIELKNADLITALRKIEAGTDFRFAYKEEQLAKVPKLDLRAERRSVEETLSILLAGTNLEFRQLNKNILITDASASLTARIVLQPQAVSPHIHSLRGHVRPEQIRIQPHTVTGRVTDADTEEGLPGVSVLLTGTPVGASTDADGRYTLELTADQAAGGTLRFSFLGYLTQEVPIDGKAAIDIALEKDVTGLEEVMVIGYGTQRKSDLTGSVASVKNEELQQRPAINLEQAFAGRITGVNVTSNSGRPGGSTRVRIRGFNSVNTSNNPLYVVDGVIGAGPVHYLNPNDIESVEVLKDASATAIYGARGANGVILVTTKRGRTDGGRVNYDTYFSLGSMARKLDVLNAQEFLEVEELAYRNAEKYDPVGWATGTKYTDPALKRTNPLLFDENGNPLYDTDWQEEATRTALAQNHQLSFTGGNEETNYGLFLGYTDEEGIMLESYMRRYSARFVLDNQLNTWLKVGGSIAFNHVEENQIDIQPGSLNATRTLLEALPIIPVTYADGSYASNADYPGMEGAENPVNILKNLSNINKNQTVLGNIYTNITLGKGLELRSVLAANINNHQRNYYSGRDLRLLSDSQRGIAEVEGVRNNYWQFENYLTWNKQFSAGHAFEGLLGVGWQQLNSFRFAAGAEGFEDDFYQSNNLGAGAVRRPPLSGTSTWAMNSYFARANYNYKEKFLATLTGRVDGSSKFGEANKYAFFPSAALAWRVSEETFLKDHFTISNLKLRTSYGMTGSSEIATYQSLAALGQYTAIFDREAVIGAGAGRLANPELKWERTAQYDAGMELGLFRNRISLEADIYYKKTSDMLLNAPVPTSSGFSSIFTNIGSMENRGFEISLNTINVEAPDFSWSTLFNISVNRNKVLALASPDDIFPGPNVISETNIVRIGEPVGSFYGYVRLGTWGEDEAQEAAQYTYTNPEGQLPGDLKLLDVNEDGEINDADRVIIGNGNPDGFGSLFNTFRYKHFDLTVELQYMYGNDILNIAKHPMEDRTGTANSFTSVLNAWTPENQDTDVGEIRDQRAYYTTNLDSRFVEDASFIRGKNLMLGYQFPRTLTQRLKLSSIRAYLSLQNFFLITKYTGYDPEVSTYTQAFTQGITVYDYPKPSIFMMGLNIAL